MKLMIQTQVMENYGAHDWDGEGECPQYWKAKGGNDYSYDLGNSTRNDESLNELIAALKSKVESSNEGYREYICGYSVESDDYLSDFERSQLEYDGRIVYPTIRLSFEDQMLESKSWVV